MLLVGVIELLCVWIGAAVGHLASRRLRAQLKTDRVRRTLGMATMGYLLNQCPLGTRDRLAVMTIALCELLWAALRFHLRIIFSVATVRTGLQMYVASMRSSQETLQFKIYVNAKLRSDQL